MSLFDLLGYTTLREYPKNQVTSVGPYALVAATNPSPLLLNVFLGGTNPQSIFYGSTEVHSIYYGNTLVWQK